MSGTVELGTLLAFEAIERRDSAFAEVSRGAEANQNYVFFSNGLRQQGGKRERQRKGIPESGVLRRIFLTKVLYVLALRCRRTVVTWD